MILPNKVDGEWKEMKHQYFHSASLIYMLLCNPESAPKNSFITPILASKNRSTFIKIVKDVLLDDPDGIEWIKFIDTKDKSKFLGVTTDNEGEVVFKKT
jgi:hypothetical protein